MEASVRTEILSAVSERRDEMVEFTQELVAIPTENPPGVYYQQCVEVLQEKLTEIGLDARIIEVPDTTTPDLPRFCILSTHGRGEKTLYFHGHYDVVPVSDSSQFDPVVRGPSLFGRGSSDMKSGLAAMIYAVKAIKDIGVELDGKIGLTFVPDEETGGLLGSRYLSDAGILGKNGIGMLMPEPTDGTIWNANRGAVSLKITLKGKPAHVGLHYQGSNAFEKMIPVANTLMGLKKEVASRMTGFNIKPDSARASILMMGGRAEGGSNFNLVPERFSFTVDRRINPEEDLETEKQQLLDLLDALKKDGIDMDVEILQEGASSGVSEDTPLARALAENIASVTGSTPAFEMCPGLLEIRFYAQQGIPALAYGPGFLTVSHGPNEFVKIENIYTCASVYALTALDLLT